MFTEQNVKFIFLTCHSPFTIAHDGNPRRTLRELLGQIDNLHDFKMAGLNRSQAALRNSAISLLTSMASRNKFGIIQVEKCAELGRDFQLSVAL